MQKIERMPLVATPWRWLWLTALLTAILLNHTAVAHAFGLNESPAARFGSDLVCTANDVSITNIAIVSGSLSSCIGGSDITLDLDLTVNFAMPDRYDVGIFIANDGNDPQLLPANGGATSCAVAVLPTSASFLNLDPGPDKNGITDTCGDGNASIGGGTGSGHLIMEDVTVNCRALSGSSGNLYIPFVVSWDNSKTTDKTTSGTCTSAADPVPNTKSKCNAPLVSQGTVAVVVLPTITKSDDTDTLVAGDNTTYRVVISNTTGDTLNGAVFTDPAVANLSLNSIACSATDGAACPATGTNPGELSVANAQGGGINIPAMPANGTVTFALDATVDANTPEGTLTNTASVTVAGASNTASDNNTILSKAGNVTLAKLTHNIGSSGYAIPGETVRYTLIVTNFDSRAIDSGSLRLVDPIPANTALVAVDPVVTVTNPAATGLTLTYGGLTDATDQVEFSTDGTNFNYQPSNLSNGTDPNVTHIRFSPAGSMNGASGGTSPSFTVTFKVKIK